MTNFGILASLPAAVQDLPPDMMDPGLDAPGVISGVPAALFWSAAVVAVAFAIGAVWVFRHMRRRMAAPDPEAQAQAPKGRAVEQQGAPAAPGPEVPPAGPVGAPDAGPSRVPEVATGPEAVLPPVVARGRARVLVAEDIASNFMLFETVLRDTYDVLHAWNGREAVDLFREQRPDVVLMDINMPVLDGYGATREIRMLSASVPIIAVTAYAYAEDKRRILESGFNAYISKPVTPQALRRQVAEALG